MLNYFLKRLLGLIPTLLIVAVLVFGFVHMLPGDPARLAAGPQADEATVALVRQDLGLDKPLLTQFTHFITHAARGDFGLSMRSKQPVSEEIGSRFMPTLWLTLVSMIWSVTTLVSRRACCLAALTVSAARATASCHTLRSLRLAAMGPKMSLNWRPSGTEPLRPVS